MSDSPDWTSSGLSPALWWDTALRSADGAVLACPQCGDQHLHLEKIRYATPSDSRYTPTIGVSIDGTQIATHGEDDDEALRLHNGTNRGAMLAIGYWCENGCRGRLELREHKGHLYLSLHEEPFGLPDFVTSALDVAYKTTASPPTPTRPSRPSEPGVETELRPSPGSATPVRPSLRAPPPADRYDPRSSGAVLRRSLESPGEQWGHFRDDMHEKRLRPVAS